MGRASTEAKNRWIKKAYKPYRVHLRFDEDKELIEWVDENKERIGISNIFRVGIETLMKDE